MAGFSDKSKEIITYRETNKYLSLKAVATKFGVKKQWVYVLCRRAGVETAAEKYKGRSCNLRNIPIELVEAVKDKSNTEGMSMRMKTIELWQKYISGIDN
jgi:hypothetical protein